MTIDKAIEQVTRAMNGETWSSEETLELLQQHKADTVCISRQELEGMKNGFKYNEGEKLRWMHRGKNNFIDKLLERT